MIWCSFQISSGNVDVRFRLLNPSKSTQRASGAGGLASNAIIQFSDKRQREYRDFTVIDPND
jgi:hypothetical protein